MFSKFRRLIVIVATLTIVGALGSCAESNQPIATGNGDIRGINAIVSSPEISFLIEERNLDNLTYKGSSGFNNFDDLNYNFNFDMFLPGNADATRVATHSLQVVADRQHTIVLSGTIANPATLAWEDAIREWTASETVFEVFFAHFALSVGNVDVYFAPTGTPPLAGGAVGLLTSGMRLEGMDFEDGEYEIILTAPGNPANILYQSVPVDTTPQTRVTIAVFDPDPSITSSIAVNLITEGGISSPVPDINFPGQLRIMHGAFGVENVDGYLQGDFNDLAFSNIEFRQRSAYVDVADLTSTLTLTPVGNSGATIHEGVVSVTPTSKRTIILGGTLAAPFYYVAVDEARSLETFPVIRLINLSINVDRLNVYLLEPGTPIDDVILPTVRDFPAPLDTGFFGADEGLQELTVTAFGESTPIATPLILDLANGDIVDMVILDTADPAMLEVVVFDSQ